ncbi:ComF operon protein 1 [Dissostichus eleginoides]|uniref:ComF operon protein 1 n=1 Tax=Dissostichus eleginoides TaxID=100907 RepID=A0AAD9CK10_DISEL|nr:ComF operon protein 1 [Dissostichus eleginoides]
MHTAPNVRLAWEGKKSNGERHGAFCGNYILQSLLTEEFLSVLAICICENQKTPGNELLAALGGDRRLLQKMLMII